MDKELLRALLEEFRTAAMEFTDGKKLLTIAVKMVFAILLKEAVLDKIVVNLFGKGVDVLTMAKTVKDSGTNLAALNVVTSNGPELTADEMEAQLKAGE